MGYLTQPRIILSLALRAIMVLITSLSAQISAAQQGSGSSPAQSLECAPGHSVSINLPGTFERVANDNPAVLCVFRNKFDGFPTLNVVTEPRHESSTPPSLAEYREGISRGYQSVGLTDARLSGETVGEAHGMPFFTSDVFFTNNGQAMAARILVVQLHDRTYTMSAVGLAKPEGDELKKLIQAIAIEGHTLPLNGQPSRTLYLIGGAVIVLAALWFTYWWRRPDRR